MAAVFQRSTKMYKHIAFTNALRSQKLRLAASFSTSLYRHSSVQASRGDTLFTEQHEQLRASLKQIIDKDINPYVDEWEAAGQFPAHQVFKKLGDGGFLGVHKPTEYGGLGLDYTYQLAMLEALGGVHCGAIPMAIGVQTDMATPALTRFGSEELKQQFLVPVIRGEQVSAIGVSEAGAGSDVASIKTTAVKDGDDYVINGSKMWITNGYQADWVCLLVNTSAGGSHGNKSLICVPMDTPGIHLARKLDKLGMRSSDTAEIFFDGVRVPQKYRVGDEGRGFSYQMLQFQEERICATAVVLLALENLIDSTTDYARQRIIFGQPLIDNQVVHFRLAELQTELECLRALTYRTVDQLVKGQDVTKIASMCKLKAGRLCREVTDSCLQYWGGMGYTTDVLVSRMYRDLRLVSIGGGADEVMLSIICKYAGTLPNPNKKK